MGNGIPQTEYCADQYYKKFCESYNEGVMRWLQVAGNERGQRKEMVQM